MSFTYMELPKISSTAFVVPLILAVQSCLFIECDCEKELLIPPTLMSSTFEFSNGYGQGNVLPLVAHSDTVTSSISYEIDVDSQTLTLRYTHSGTAFTEIYDIVPSEIWED